MVVSMRIVAIAVVLSLLSPPLAPLARAQQAPPAPAPAPATPAPPGLYHEALKTEERAVTGTDVAYSIGAGFTNVLYVPGKFTLCGLGTIVAVGFMAMTLGAGYRGAAGAVREGCGGKWFLRGSDLRPEARASKAFDWEPEKD